MSEQYCAEHDFYYSPNHIIDVVCPWCEIDRLNKEISKLRQYEDAITSAVDGTLLVWNLMSTNHTVIKNDYWQNHLEEIDRLKAELEQARQLLVSEIEEARKEHKHYTDLERQLAEVKGAEVCYNETISDLRESLAEARVEIDAHRTIETELLAKTITSMSRRRFGLEG